MQKVLYTKDQTEMNDIKKELGKKKQRANYVDSEEFDKMMEIVGKLNIIKTLILLYDNQNDFCVSTKSEYYAGLRRYLIMEKKDSFCIRVFSSYTFFPRYRKNYKYIE